MVAAHQQITETWWREIRPSFDLFVSEAVVNEAAAGDPNAATTRLQILEGLDLLEITPDAETLAASLVTRAIVPKKAVVDALHIAIATVHGMDYLLTWNCRHIANAQLHHRLVDSVAALGYQLPVICTPEELFGR